MPHLTCDREYVTDILNQDLPCPCVVLLPAEDLTEALAKVPVMFGCLQYYIDEHGLMALRDATFHCVHDGMHYIKHGRDALEASLDRIVRNIEEYMSRDLGKDIHI